jgi:hypothetical protein
MDVFPANNYISIHYQEVPIDHAFRHPDCVSRAQLFLLSTVGYAYFPFLAIAEIITYLFIVISDNEDKFLDASVLGFDKQMFKYRLIGDGQHHLRSGVGQRTHTAAFPGS